MSAWWSGKPLWLKVGMAYAYVVLVGLFLTILLTFFAAYFSPTRSIVVTVNQLHEARIEAALLLTALPFVLYHLYDDGREVLEAL